MKCEEIKIVCIRVTRYFNNTARHTLRNPEISCMFPNELKIS